LADPKPKNVHRYAKKWLGEGGGWGGLCTCPDGQEYLVGDKWDSCKSLACIGGKPGKCMNHEGAWSGYSVSCDRKLPKTRNPKNFDIIIPYTIESTVKDFGDVGGKDEYLIVGNHSTFFQNISENLPKNYPKSQYLKKIAQYMETQKPEQFSTHLAFNFPDRHYWYFYGNFDKTLEYFVNEATKIMKTIGLDSVERKFPILSVLHRQRFTASFLNITLNVILSVLLYIAAMVIYSFISNTANSKVYEIAIERVLGMKKYNMVEMMVTNSLWYSTIGIAVGCPFISYIFRFFNWVINSNTNTAADFT
jgi:hypothetical protein